MAGNRKMLPTDRQANAADEVAAQCAYYLVVVPCAVVLADPPARGPP
jgi:hypothetical protein